MATMTTIASRARVLLVALACAIPGVIGFVDPPASSAGEGALSAVLAGPLDGGTIAVRQKAFGVEYVDPETGYVSPNHLILNWNGNATFAASLGGRVVLLDAWVQTGFVMGNGRYPLSLEDLIAIRPEAMIIGHGHVDHVGHAAWIASQLPGIAMYGTKEICEDTLRLMQAMPGSGKTLNCKSLLSDLDNTPGDRIDHPYLPPVYDGDRLVARGLSITGLLHIHSTRGLPADPTKLPETDGRLPCPIVNDLSDIQQLIKYPAAPAEVLKFRATSRGMFGPAPVGTGPNGNVVWQFRLDDTFTLTYFDTVGPLRDDAPQVLGALEALPPTDLLLGSPATLGAAVVCMRDIGDYIRALKPKIYMPNHHDFALLGVTQNAERYKANFDTEYVRIPAAIRPIVRWIWDPISDRLGDFGRPEAMTFDLTLPYWDDGEG